MQSATIPNQSQSLLHAMARQAEQNWGDFSQTVNGKVLLDTPEMPVEQRIKAAFIHGDIMAQTATVAQFIQDGLNSFLLPHRRVVWNLPTRIGLNPGQALLDVVFIATPETDKPRLLRGRIECKLSEPSLLEPDAPQVPEFHFIADGDDKPTAFVVAWIQQDALLSTFLHNL